MGQTGTALDTQLGLVLEPSYGQPTVPTRFLRYDSETFDLNRSTTEDNGLGGGDYFTREVARVVTGRDGTGGFVASLHNSGFGLLFQLACGSSTITQRVAPNAVVWDQVHTPGTLRGKSATVQVGEVQRDGTVVPYTISGWKIGELDISIAGGGIAKISVTGPSQDIRTPGSTPAGLALATASPSATSVPFSFRGATLTVNGSALPGIKTANARLTNPFASADDARYIGGGGLRDEPLINDFRKADGTLAGDFIDRTLLYDAFDADSTLGLVLAFAGPNIGATSIPSSLTINMPAIKLNGEKPKISGPGVIPMSSPYEVLRKADGSPAITYTLVSGDTAY